MSRRAIFGFYILTTDPWGAPYAYFSAYANADNARASRDYQAARLGAANVGPVQTSDQPNPFAAPRRPGLLVSLARIVMLVGAALAAGVSVLLMRIACPKGGEAPGPEPRRGTSKAPQRSAPNDWRVN